MIIYVICFAISIILLYISEKISKKTIKIFVTLIALIIPCILAGLRSVNIGTDTLNYKNYFYNVCEMPNNLGIFLNYSSRFEIGYRLLNFFIAKIFNNYHIFLFVEEILIIFFTYFGLKKYKELENKVWFAMLIFYTLFYNVTLNVTRQFISVAILFWGFSWLLNDKSRKRKLLFCTALILSYSFHRSSIIGIIIYIMYEILRHEKERKKVLKLENFRVHTYKVSIVLLLIFVTIVLMNLNIIFEILGNAEDIKGYRYIENGLTSVSVVSMLINFPIIIVYLMVRKSYMKKYDNSWFYILVFFIYSFIISSLDIGNYYASRVGYLFKYFNLVSVPILMDCFEVKNTQKIVSYGMIAYFVFYWWLFYVNVGYNQTVPYKFYF